jgi:ABC-2 type transport system ATP-binding protein
VDRGEIFYKGRRVRFNHSAYKKETGYIPAEAPFFYGWMTVDDLLDLNSSFYLTWNARKTDCFSALGFFTIC